MRIVVKIGTSTLAYPTGRLNIRLTETLVKVLSDLKNAGHEIILVSSGAIAVGFGKLLLPSRPTEMSVKQACAAVGQCELMYTYDRLFTVYNHTVAQILLTGADMETPDRRQNFQNTLTRLLEMGALPIINENDTVSTDEITSIGDNDTLAAIVSHCIHADLLVLLSDIDGLYTAEPPHPPGGPARPAGGGDHAGDPRAGRWGWFGAGHRRHVHQAPRRQARDGRRGRYGHRQRLPPGAAVRYCRGQTCGHPLCGP